MPGHITPLSLSIFCVKGLEKPVEELGLCSHTNKEMDKVVFRHLCVCGNGWVLGIFSQACF